MTTLTITTSTITSTTASTSSLVTSSPYPMSLLGPRPQFRQQNELNLLQFNNSVVLVSDANGSSQMSNLQETLKQLKESLDKSSTSKFNIRREYKLTIETPLNIWLDFLTSELTAHDLLDVIDDSIQPSSNIPL